MDQVAAPSQLAEQNEHDEAELGAPAESGRPLATARETRGDAPIGQEELGQLAVHSQRERHDDEEQRLAEIMPLLEQAALQLKEKVANLEATLNQLLARLGTRVGIGLGC